MAFFSTIRTMADAVAYTRLMIGAGVNNVELTDDGIRQCVVDAHQIFVRYLCGEGSYEDYIVFTLKAGVSRYQMPREITDVFEFNPSRRSGGISIFSNSPNASMTMGFFGGAGSMSGANRLNSFNINGDASGLLGNDRQVGYDLMNFTIASIVGADIDHLTKKPYIVNHHPQRGELVVTPTPTQNEIGLLGVWRRETIENSIDHPLVKKMYLGKAKILWANVAGKYQITLAGGGTINTGDMLSQGEKAVDEAEASMKDEREPLGLYIG